MTQSPSHRPDDKENISFEEAKADVEKAAAEVRRRMVENGPERPTAHASEQDIEDYSTFAQPE